jgi:hypothetical protein
MSSIRCVVMPVFAGCCYCCRVMPMLIWLVFVCDYACVSWMLSLMCGCVRCCWQSLLCETTVRALQYEPWACGIACFRELKYSMNCSLISSPAQKCFCVLLLFYHSKSAYIEYCPCFKDISLINYPWWVNVNLCVLSVVPTVLSESLHAFLCVLYVVPVVLRSSVCVLCCHCCKI